MNELFATLQTQLSKQASVLDIGVNNGALSLRFVKELELEYLKGIEAAPEPTYNKEIVINHPNIEFTYNQPIQTFTDDRKYDMVVMFKTLHYTAFPESNEAITIAKSFLKQQGLVLLGLPLNANTSDGDRRTLDLDEIKKNLTSTGFEILYDKPVDDYDIDYSATHILLSRLK